MAWRARSAPRLGCRLSNSGNICTTMGDPEDDYESLAHTQRLKAAVHYTTGQLCEEVGEDMTASKQFIAVLSEATFKYSQRMATDLELFAKHAKRNTVNADDVKLLVRKSPQLLEYIQEQSEALVAVNEQKRAKRGAAGTKRTAGSKKAKKKSTSAADSTNNVQTGDEDSNM